MNTDTISAIMDHIIDPRPLCVVVGKLLKRSAAKIRLCSAMWRLMNQIEFVSLKLQWHHWGELGGPILEKYVNEVFPNDTQIRNSVEYMMKLVKPLNTWSWRAENGFPTPRVILSDFSFEMQINMHAIYTKTQTTKSFGEFICDAREKHQREGKIQKDIKQQKEMKNKKIRKYGHTEWTMDEINIPDTTNGGTYRKKPIHQFA